MAGISTDPDAYYRVFKALHLVTHEALPCVDNALKVWHSQQQQTLPPCAGHCPDGKKPKLPASCQNCVNWGIAIEAALYPPLIPPAKPQMTWQNINQSDLGKNHIEAAKAFVLRLPKNKTNPGPTPYTRISDFDSASVLMIMAKFSGFHGGDRGTYDKVMKVFELRNSLSHMGLKNDMNLDDTKVTEYFRDMDALVDCLGSLHPNYLSSQDIKKRLAEIKMEPVTAVMKEEIGLQVKNDLQLILQTTKEMKEEIESMRKVVEKQVTENECSFDQIQCQNQLKADYKANRGGMGFLPWMPKEYPLEEFFVDLSLVQEEIRRPTQVKRKGLVRLQHLLVPWSGRHSWH